VYAAFLTATAIGVTLGALLPEAEEIGLDLVFPLSFLVLLLPLVRTRRQAAVAALAAGLAQTLGRFGGGVAVLGATVGGAAVGALLDGRRSGG
jgi:predicted branched-subunit amino acid permease